MNKQIAAIVLAMSFIPAFLTGCGEKKEESASAAIEKSKSFQTMEEQADYLVDQANKFYKSDEYKDAIALSQHVLSKLDSESEQAKEILEEAKADLAKEAEKATDDLKNAVKGIGK